MGRGAGVCSVGQTQAKRIQIYTGTATCLYCRSGVALLSIVLLDAFQTIILPRRPVGQLRITRAFFVCTWQPWRWIASRLRSRSARDEFYSVYGPMSLLLLFFVWALLLTSGFGLIFYGLHVPFRDAMLSGSHFARLRSCLYVSGTTIFTLGLGDVVPQSHMARLFVVVEAGTGLGFIALVIGYVPVLYGAFSQRELQVALLDSRAGSPPTATELLVRHSFDGGPQTLRVLLAEWEHSGHVLRDPGDAGQPGNAAGPTDLCARTARSGGSRTRLSAGTSRKAAA